MSPGFACGFRSRTVAPEAPISTGSRNEDVENCDRVIGFGIGFRRPRTCERCRPQAPCGMARTGTLPGPTGRRVRWPREPRPEVRPRRRVQGDHRAAAGGRAAVLRHDRQGASGCPRPRCASGCSASSTPEVMQIVAVTDPLQVGFRRQAMIGIRVDGDLTPVGDALDGDVRGLLRRHDGRVASTCSPRSSARTTRSCSTCSPGGSGPSPGSSPPRPSST